MVALLEDRMKDWVVTMVDLCHEHNHQDWVVSKRKKWIGAWEKNNHRDPNSQPKLVLKAQDDSAEEAREKIYWVPITKSACLSKGWPSKAKTKTPWRFSLKKQEGKNPETYL